MITLDEARGLLARAVLTKGPEFVYTLDPDEKCYYEPLWRRTDPGDPRYDTGCLVGVALGLAGETRHHGARGSVKSLHLACPDMMSVWAAAYFSTAQWAQDGGDTWGGAYRAAEDAVSTLRDMTAADALSFSELLSEKDNGGDL